MSCALNNTKSSLIPLLSSPESRASCFKAGSSFEPQRLAPELLLRLMTCTVPSTGTKRLSHSEPNADRRQTLPSTPKILQYKKNLARN